MFKKRKNNRYSDLEISKTLHKNLDFSATEQYKRLRANLNFTLPDDVECPVIGVSSSARGEGKSTTSINLAYVLAENGDKVLLLDGDLRIPSVSKKMEIKSTPGLTDLLVGDCLNNMEQFKSNIFDNWYVVPSGNLPPNPSELVGSKKMEKLLQRLKKDFDYIIVDLPPVNLVSDVASISSYLDGLVLIVRQDITEKKEFDACVKQLKLSNINVLGCVLNEEKSDGYSHKYKKHYRNYYKNYEYRSDKK